MTPLFRPTIPGIGGWGLGLGEYSAEGAEGAGGAEGAARDSSTDLPFLPLGGGGARGLPWWSRGVV
jgi:hypothetical protein